jgi:glycosyltransferase involved in cell wall biosynthesis
VPFIYDAHDFYRRIEESEEHLPVEERWMKSVYAKVESLCVRKAAAVVTVSEGVAELHREAFGCQPVIIRNCQDPRLDRSPPQTLRRLLGLSDDEFLLVTVGQAKAGQALSEAFDAMRLLPDRVHLALVGARYEQHLEEIRGKGLEGRVHPVPPVKPYEVVPFIQSADAALILYYPRSVNYAYCLPNGFFQSVTAELPLLYPELREIKRVAEQYNLGIAIDPRSAESIRSGVAELLTDQEKLLTFKRNLRAAKHELSWEKEEILLKDLISKIIG